MCTTKITFNLDASLFSSHNQSYYVSLCMRLFIHKLYSSYLLLGVLLGNRALNKSILPSESCLSGELTMA